MYSCQSCGRTYTRGHDLRRHEKHKHRDEDDIQDKEVQSSDAIQSIPEKPLMKDKTLEYPEVIEVPSETVPFPWLSPCSILVVGPTQCGKTVLTKV